MSESEFQPGEQWELYYHQFGDTWFLGRGEFVRLMFEVAGVPYLDQGRLNPGCVKDVIGAGAAANPAGFPCFAPPIIKKGDFILCQTPSIMKFLGKQLGLYPDNIVDEAHADSMNAFVTDFVSEGRLVFHSQCFTAGYAVQKDSDQVKGTIKWFKEERLAKFLNYFEAVLGHTASGFVVGKSLTYVDVAVFHCIEATAAQFPDEFLTLSGSTPLVVAHRAMVREIPNIASYLASDRRGVFAGDSMM